LKLRDVTGEVGTKFGERAVHDPPEKCSIVPIEPAAQPSAAETMKTEKRFLTVVPGLTGPVHIPVVNWISTPPSPTAQPSVGLNMKTDLRGVATGEVNGAQTPAV
jgi:hypothetical protein